jgi:hypothetical protein
MTLQYDDVRCGAAQYGRYSRQFQLGNTAVGQLLLLQAQASQLEAGLPINLLEEPTVHIPHLTPTCMLSMRRFMSNHNIESTATESFIIKLNGKNDKYIMDFKRLKGYTTSQQKDLNLV